MKSLYANQTRDSGLALLPAFVKEDTQPIAEIPIQKMKKKRQKMERKNKQQYQANKNP